METTFYSQVSGTHELKSHVRLRMTINGFELYTTPGRLRDNIFTVESHTLAAKQALSELARVLVNMGHPDRMGIEGVFHTHRVTMELAPILEASDVQN